MPLTWGTLPSVKTEPVKEMNVLKWNCLLRKWNVSPLLCRKFSLYNVTSKYTKFFLGGLYDWHNQCAFWSYVYVCVCVCVLLHLKWLLGLMGSGILWIILDSLVSFPLCLPLSSKLIHLVFLTSHGWWFFSWEKKLATPWRSSSDCKTDFPEARALQLPSTPWTPEPWSLFLCNKQWIQWWETAWTSDAWRPHKECTSTACQASGTQEFHIRFWKTRGLLHVSVGFLYIWISLQLMWLTFHLLKSSLRRWSEWVPNVPLQIDYLLGLQPRWTTRLLPTSGSSGPSCPRKTTK
jgi:hypothetical protein